MNRRRALAVRTQVAVLVAALALPLTACGDDGSEGEGGRQKLTVFAAASLTSTFEQLEAQFENDHPDADVQLSFGGSSDLVAQIADGAAADVFASADTKNMDQFLDADLADGEPTEFATNTLVIAVPPGNPAGITGLADLGKEDLDIVVCAPEVPCGNAAVQVADAAGVRLAPDSEEQSVTDVLGKIESGEADAGLVYVTDVEAADGAVEGVEFPEAVDVVNHYPIVVVAGSDETDLARAWIDLVLGDGQAVLGRAGFGPPAS
ncbi:molybdate ABC transporter substrate-binding protein [Nocardioides caeni]|uniref:Molybdate ABC transporter substrate-binding protein n=1 Tax=Nocardioides caeni TaxID=574700 RepID=A0A4S8NE19_9ACTN|nr:molybdate ABC transporter substrate-binding protein [Nocardioides caeni]THV14545.1 molybdate ABC transporter substrate-binding protein [Nocardioides caeni]